MNDLVKLKRINSDHILLLSTDPTCIFSHLKTLLAVILFSYRLLLNVPNGIKRLLRGPQLNNQHFSQSIKLMLTNCDFFMRKRHFHRFTEHTGGFLTNKNKLLKRTKFISGQTVFFQSSCD